MVTINDIDALVTTMVHLPKEDEVRIKSFNKIYKKKKKYI